MSRTSKASSRKATGVDAAAQIAALFETQRQDEAEETAKAAEESEKPAPDEPSPERPAPEVSPENPALARPVAEPSPERPAPEVSPEKPVSDEPSPESVWVPELLPERQATDEPSPESVWVPELLPERQATDEPSPEPVWAPEPVPVQTAPPAILPGKPVVSQRPRLAVLGSPIGHSKSPDLHRAAYEVLGLDWEYGREEVVEAALPAYLDGLGEEWRGLSLTMPLKKAVIPLLTDIDRVAAETGAANTVLFDGEEVRGFNTDVGGIVRALSAAGLERVRYVHILGGGATAASALVAAAELGAERVDLHVRDLEKSLSLEPPAHGLGLRIRIRSFLQADRSLDIPELVISTLPGDVSIPVLYTDSTRRRAVLLDVAYEPWPTPLARAWQSVGGTVVSGLGMLVHQALLQVRVFVSGDPLEPLPDEEAVLRAMLAVAGVDAAGAPLEAAADTPGTSLDGAAVDAAAASLDGVGVDAVGTLPEEAAAGA
ncbi:shikimate 5-dehydrogenase [Leifsonia xyli subsp. cynodontis DSM 46306]|uniref:Shikimate dehydrogenase substrate binding N-terminal domain-containing protein n=1 Tax=Leifsonia xyli subsp. cynodontis DSM 46306 TaxID=1389489 RepID=U3P727_LEIXC|nr:shikimate dehydrogenase [Leifsonia xyli]AGW41264.1 shikimate 5-dehydrogenase [Leifsonia xyli subsp. cynodontis DSM 46306]